MFPGQLGVGLLYLTDCISETAMSDLLHALAPLGNLTAHGEVLTVTV